MRRKRKAQGQDPQAPDDPADAGARLREREVLALTPPARGRAGFSPLASEIDSFHGPLVRVTSGCRVVASRAVLADMDDPMVILERADAAQGVYSEGFASCLALVLRTDHAVGLAHTSQVGSNLRRFIDRCLREFRQAQPGAVAVTVGYAPVGWRQDIALQRASGRIGLDDFVDDQEASLGPSDRSIRAAVQALPAQATPEARWDAATEAIVGNLRMKAEQAARYAGGQVLELPHGALLVPVRGPIELFLREPRHRRLRGTG